ncbi:phosphopantetheine-binding protein [Nonomuraea sp. NBC_00507]|uniref:phosphopantetheine-binding protein n=1 Tax=Nonomuraea sp. NBC_00507 TaxID=2976002 RepID=UPI002E16F3E9
MAKIQHHLEHSLGARIPLTTLYAHPTIRSLARRLADEAAAEEVEGVERADTATPRPRTPADRRHSAASAVALATPENADTVRPGGPQDRHESRCTA